MKLYFLIPGYFFLLIGAAVSHTAIASSSIGFTYSESLADKMALDASKATVLSPPLLGIAIEIKAGIVGKVVQLHLFIQNDAPIRWPEKDIIIDAGPNTDQLPFGFLGRLKNKEVKSFIFGKSANLAYLTMNRHGMTPLGKPVKVTEDKEASYSSLPVSAYMKSFLPGVMWLSISANSELLAREAYRYHYVYFEKSGVKGNPLRQNQMDPDQLIGVEIPMTLIEGMRKELQSVADETLQRRQPIQYEVFQ
jgi:hypothetical protein